MTFDPEEHGRGSIRLPGYDYTQPGAYFVTICTQNRKPFSITRLFVGLLKGAGRRSQALRILFQLCLRDLTRFQ